MMELAYIGVLKTPGESRPGSSPGASILIFYSIKLLRQFYRIEPP